MTKKCIYCLPEREEKEESAFSEEHVIPQLLGGAHSNAIFKTGDVCIECNSTLGLNVDASFGRTWFVSSWLQQSALACFDRTAPKGAPLFCMGLSSLTPPNMADNELCEHWVGALGETVYWVRPKDDKRFWYSGGNPIATKAKESRAYHFFSARSADNEHMSWYTFRDSFKDRLKVKKILCTKVGGADPLSIGFKAPDELDQARIEYFKQRHAEGDNSYQNRLLFNVCFDIQFLAKMALGGGYCLFGQAMLDTEYSKELRKGMWHEWSLNEDEGFTEDSPNILCQPFLLDPPNKLPELLLDKHAVTIIIGLHPLGIGLGLYLGHSVRSSVLCVPYESVTEDMRQVLGAGKVIVLYRGLQKGVYMDLPEYIAHMQGVVLNKELTAIQEALQAIEAFRQASAKPNS